MSKVCITIPSECKSCYPLCVEYCPDSIHINGITEYIETELFLFAVDHFGNVYSNQIITNEDGTFDIDLSNYPSGFFNSNSGAINIFLSQNEDGSNPIEIEFDNVFYTCILITTQAAVDFVQEDVTIFNPGESICGVTPGWTIVWGNIEGTITNQYDLIEYISNNTINCETLPDCQTIIDINTELDGKFDIPTGTALDYLDGTGTPTLFPSIPSQYNPTAGTGISITGTYPNQTITNTDPDQIVVISGGTAILVTGTYPNFTIDNLSPDQIVALSNGTGISISGTYPNFTISNSAPDQVVVLSNGSGISVTGSYPNFTITNTSPDQTVSLTASTGISISGSYPNFTITNSSPDQTVSLTAGSGISISGTYPNFTITNSSVTTGTVTSVGLSAGTGISLSGTNPITTSGTITVTNSAPDQIVSLSAGTGISTSGTYPSFTVTNTAPDQTVSLSAGTGISVTGTYPSFTISNTATSGGLKSGTATAAVTDVYTTTITGVTAYTTNDAYVIKFNTANSNGATININGLGAVQLTKNNDVILTGGDITVGQEFIIIYDGTNFQMLGIAPNQMFAYVTNADSVTITKGQAVYAFGASGDRMSVKLANNTSEATSSKTVGLVFSNSIAAGGLGFVITQGVLSNVNTASYTAGDTLYLGSSAGALTNTMPFAPNHLTRIGIVERTNAGNGLIYVLVQNGFQLDELSDVDIITVAPVNNDVLTYVTGVNNLWKPRSIATILGYTPVTNARTLTINGTSYDLTANRSWSVGTVTSVTGTLPISSSGGATPDISISQANSTTNGYLSSTDWNTFNGKQNALGFTPEDVSNKSSSYTASSTTTYANTKALVDGLATKQNTLTNPITGTGTNNEIAYFNTTGSTISSLTTATYPSLTELSYVKGVTSAIQTQLAAKPSQDTFVLQFYHGGAFSPADNTTYYFSYSSNAIGTAAANVDMNLGYAFKIVGVQLFIAGNTTAGTAENVTLQVRNVTQATSSSVGTYQTNASSATATANFTFTGLNISIGASDFFCLQIDTPTWVTNPVGCNHRANLICERQ